MPEDNSFRTSLYWPYKELDSLICAIVGAVRNFFPSSSPQGRDRSSTANPSVITPRRSIFETDFNSGHGVEATSRISRTSAPLTQGSSNTANRPVSPQSHSQLSPVEEASNEGTQDGSDTTYRQTSSEKGASYESQDGTLPILSPSIYRKNEGDGIATSSSKSLGFALANKISRVEGANTLNGNDGSSGGWFSRYQALSSKVKAYISRFSRRLDKLLSKNKYTEHFALKFWIPIILFSAVTYPYLLLVAFLANEKSLSVARIIVNFGSGLFAMSYGFFLFKTAEHYLAACTWSLVMQKSREDGGLEVQELSSFVDPDPGFITGAGLILRSCSLKSAYGTKKLVLCSILLVIFVVVKENLSFFYERTLLIAVYTVAQNKNCKEVFVWGELSPFDVANADNLLGVYTTFEQTWTLVPFASLTEFPSAVSFFDQVSNDTVYFLDSYSNQLRSDGGAYGTFNETALSKDTTAALFDNSSVTDSDDSGFLQFPKWGIRIQCSRIPDPTNNIVPLSNSGVTYVFVTEDVVQELFASLKLSYPNLPALNTTGVLQGNDTLPSGINATALVAAGVFAQNGVAHSFKSIPTDYGESGNGWTEIEILSVRLNTTFTPNGTFPVYYGSATDANGAVSQIGYDAAVCVEVYEPWVVEIFNGTGTPPSSNRLLGALSQNSSISAASRNSTSEWNVWKQETRVKGSLHPGENDVPTDMNWSLNSTGKFDAFAVAHDNSINQMVKDNGRDFWYVPSNLLVSFTNGSGPNGYTELSAVSLASTRALADATNVLPFLAGSGPLAARFYPSSQKAHVHVNKYWSGLVIGLHLLLGFVICCTVPRLPDSVPHRGFDFLTYCAILFGDELTIQNFAELGVLKPNDTIEEVEQKIGKVKVVYGS